MCDYSLHGIRNRLAEKGETLVVHRFSTGSKGLTSPESIEPTEKLKRTGVMAFVKAIFAARSTECAVCIPDGARVVLHGISPRLQTARSLAVMETATFRQMSAEPATYRDAFEFENGARVRLQELEEGQAVDVLALSSEESSLPPKFISGPVQPVTRA